MCWRLILEEFGPGLKYIKGESNAVAYALSRLEISDNRKILNISYYSILDILLYLRSEDRVVC